MAIPQYGDAESSKLDKSAAVFNQAVNDSPDQTLQNNMQGTEAAKGLLQPNQNYEAGLGSANAGADSGLHEAVRNKYMGTYEQGNQQLMHEQKLQATAQHFEKVQHASQLVNEEMKMNYDKEMEKYKREQAKKAARGAIVGQVLGIVGAAVGGYFSGGAAAGAGYAAGNAAGQAIGGG